jgi:hypothetical protein
MLDRGVVLPPLLPPAEIQGWADRAEKIFRVEG